MHVAEEGIDTILGEGGEEGFQLLGAGIVAAVPESADLICGGGYEGRWGGEWIWSVGDGVW